MKQKSSIKAKLLFNVVGAVTIIFILVGIIIFIQARNVILNESNNTLHAESKNITNMIDKHFVSAAEIVKQMEASNFIIDYMDKVHTKNEIKTPEEYQRIISNMKKIKSSNSNLSLVYLALAEAGNIVTDDEWANPPDFNVNTREWYKESINNGKLTYSEPYIDNVTGKMVITVSTPVKNSSGKLLGAVCVDMTLDQISNIMSKFTLKKTGFAFLADDKGTMLYHPDSELILKDNITKYEGKPGEIAQKMVKGETGVDTVEFNKQKQYMAYAPVESSSWSVGVVVPVKEIQENMSKFQATFILAILSTIVILSVLIYFLASGILKPIPVLLKAFDAAMKGDMTVRANVVSTDEIGRLAEGFNTMIESQHNIIRQVLSASNDIFATMEKQNLMIGEIVAQTDETSATVEELSAGMEETAASSEEINASSADIEKAVESIASKAQDGAVSAAEINKRANELKSNAVESQKNANSIYSSANSKLRHAIEQSKAVEQINVLSNAILQITSQTNLLALNAAIEAARAGEAGKGFAVVAEEIRKLAEDSKNTVNEIQKITKTVVQSVENLSESSKQVLEFIDKQVTSDYNSLVKTGEQYNKDAEFIDTVVTDFSATSEELMASIQGIMKAINEVSITINEGAEGTQNIAEKTMAIVENVDAIRKEILKSNQSASMLKELVSRFTI